MREGLVADWNYIGALLANQDDNVQAAFFKAFCREVRSWPTSYAGDFQMANIGEKLTDEEKDLLGHITYKGD